MYYVLLADGFEEIEALTVTDVLRRAEVDVMNASLTGEYEVKGAHGITVKCDITIKEALEADDAQGVILPGGMPGTRNIEKSAEARRLTEKMNSEGRLVAAVCAAPSVLGKMGILEGKKCTCYPGFEEELKGARVKKASVLADGNVITSRGPGTALDFALALTEYITGKSSEELARSMMYKR